MGRSWLTIWRLTIWLVAASVGVASGCGGSSGASGAELAARAAITAAAALAVAAAESRGRTRREGRLESEDAEDAFPTGQPWDLPSPPTSSGPEPLPLWQVRYEADVQAEDIWCRQDEDCVMIRGVDCCSCDEGGTALAVNRSAAPRLEAELAERCEAASCPGSTSDASCSARVACRNDLCRLFRRLPPVETSEVEDLPPVPPPPGS